MVTENLRGMVDAIAIAVEVVGVAVISLAFIYGLGEAGLRLRRGQAFYERLKDFTGKALLLGLEFFVAADIVRTVAIRPTREGILSLGLLVAVRTFLSWSIIVEVDGCWPWKAGRKRNDKDSGD